MREYVLGFLFSKSFPSGTDNYVALISKIKPEWQYGLLNGIGGKIEENELPENAMRREFREETGLEIDDWKKFCKFTDEKGYIVHAYCSDIVSTQLGLCKLQPLTEEVPNWYAVDKLDQLPVIPNLHWLIAMAIWESKNNKYYDIIERNI